MRRSKSSNAFGRGSRAAEGERGEPSSEKEVEAAAVALLARREHSLAELKRKLGRRHPEALVEAVVTRLAAKNLASDTRFTTNFVHHHARRGQGPLRIRAELRQQGIADVAITAALNEAGLDWGEVAGAVRRRKFGAGRPRSPAERAKQARFLQYRGFNGDQIRAAFTSAAMEPSLEDPSSEDNSIEESQDSAGQADAGFDLDLES